jgi:hypothetical protein
MRQFDDIGLREKQTALEIKEAISTALKEIAPGCEPVINFYKVKDSTDLFSILDDIADASKNKGLKPWVHFEMHGQVDGLRLMNEELVPWNQLAKPIRLINTNCGNNLFVALATCYGAHFLKLYKRFDLSAPFYGYVGCFNQ